VQNYCNYLISCYKFSIWICYKNEFTFESLSNLNKTSRLTSNLNHTKTHVLRVRKCSSIPDMSFVKKPNTIYFYIKRYTIFNKSTMNSSYIFIYTSDICDRKKNIHCEIVSFFFTLELISVVEYNNDSIRHNITWYVLIKVVC